MYLQYSELGNNLIFIPNNKQWRLESSYDESASIYLYTDNEEPLTVANSAGLLMHCEKLDVDKIIALYDDIIEKVAEIIAQDPDIKFINLFKIQKELVYGKYKEKWLAEGLLDQEYDGLKYALGE